jgi:hypothetical protein
VLVGILNLRIVHNSNYHFYKHTELEVLLGPCSIRSTYADQAWLAVVVKEGAK